MEATFTIPDGFELKQTGENKFEIVPKINIQQNIYNSNNQINQNDYQQPGNYNSFIKEQMEHVVENKWEQLQPMDYEYDMDHSYEERELDRMFSGNAMHELYKSGKLRLSRDERQLLEFCHSVDMKKFLKEEVGDKPIRLEGDDDGNFWLADRY